MKRTILAALALIALPAHAQDKPEKPADLFQPGETKSTGSVTVGGQRQGESEQ